MSVWITMLCGRVEPKRIKALEPIRQKFEKKKGSYRINLYSVDFAKAHRDRHPHLTFTPCGKVTLETTGEFRYLKMRNGKMEIVEPTNRKKSI